MYKTDKDLLKKIHCDPDTIVSETIKINLRAYIWNNKIIYISTNKLNIDNLFQNKTEYKSIFKNGKDAYVGATKCILNNGYMYYYKEIIYK